MPLSHKKSQSAFQANVSQLRHDGYGIKQALAIAYDIMRGGKKEERCWKGYEPVPNKAPYSPDSCRKEEILDTPAESHG